MTLTDNKIEHMAGEYIAEDWQADRYYRNMNIVAFARNVEAAVIARAAVPATWQPIETAPKDERVLLWVPAFGPWIASCWPGSWAWAREQWALHTPFSGRGDRAIMGTDAPPPTHWMPLPAAPLARQEPAAAQPSGSEALRTIGAAGPLGDPEVMEPFWCHEQSHDRPRCEAQCAECAEDGAPASDERKQAEQAYTVGAFDYPSNPVGSRDWTLFWQGWQARAAGAKAGVDPEPLLYLSVKQLPSLGEGYYIPYRLKPEGNFQFPVYAASGVALPRANEPVCEKEAYGCERCSDAPCPECRSEDSAGVLASPNDQGENHG